jgi:hypothetical protein
MRRPWPTGAVAPWEKELPPGDNPIAVNKYFILLLNNNNLFRMTDIHGSNI